MPRLILPILLLCALFTGSLSWAQTLYNVRVGTFEDVRGEEFADLRDLGFVYGNQREGRLTDVYLGNYSGQARAEAVVATLAERGYRNATPLSLPADREPLTVVQLALAGQQPDWPALSRAGQLHVESVDGGPLKVVTGPYSSPTAAKEDLDRIKDMGYKDAFVRSVDPARLIGVGTFETGIKEALIPLDLDRSAPPPPPAATEPPPSDSFQVAPPVRSTPTAPATAPTAAAMPTYEPALPEIDVDTKRHSAAELQRVLKERGYYDGSIDGFYGPGTRAAYEAATEEMDRLRNYRTLAALANEGDASLQWPELSTLLYIAYDIAAGQENMDVANEIRHEGDDLMQATTPLPPDHARQARQWESETWAGLDAWATEDPLHADILTALRVAYYQAQARLEAMYAARGMAPNEARSLATAVLERYLAGALVRFSI